MIEDSFKMIEDVFLNDFAHLDKCDSKKDVGG